MKDVILTHISELKGIATRIGEEIKADEIRELRERLALLAVLKARVNNIMPDVNYYYDNELASVTHKIVDEFKDNLKGNNAYIKNYIAGEMREYQRAVNLCERINSTIERQSENYRSILSSIKNEQNLN